MIKSSFNALHNIHNYNQTGVKRVLCVCSAGLLRSPTIANVLHKDYGYNTRCAGVIEDYALIPVSEALLHWADEIVCADYSHSRLIEAFLSDCNIDKPVIILELPDRFPWNDNKLQSLIRERYAERKNQV